jgi:hypothetical protein
MEKDLNLAHKFVVKFLKNLKNQSCDIKKVVERQISQEILDNCLRIKALIDIYLFAQILSMCF